MLTKVKKVVKSQGIFFESTGEAEVNQRSTGEAEVNQRSTGKAEVNQRSTGGAEVKNIIR